jgi:hypothetical protein
MATLNAGGVLNLNQDLPSDNGAYRLIMQTDGNLVLYGGAVPVGNAIWATNTWDRPPALRATRAVMQEDGNFVLYTSAGYAAWATGTFGNPGSRLVMQDDRNLVIYNADNNPIWATMTNIPAPERRTGQVTAVSNEEVGWGKRMDTTATLYRDGRLVVDSYTRNDNWTGALRGRTFVVVADAQGRSIWASRIFEDPTRCSILDPGCASYGRVTHIELFPEAVGQYVEQLDIYHADDANFVDLRAALIDAIKATGDVADAVREEWEQLQRITG